MGWAHEFLRLACILIPPLAVKKNIPVARHETVGWVSAFASSVATDGGVNWSERQDSHLRDLGPKPSA